MTNRDKINNMTNEQFAEFIKDRNFYCFDYCKHTKDDCDCCDYFNEDCFIAWLESEVK